MYIIAISHFYESRTAIQLIFVMLHARKTLCNVTKAHGAYMHEVDCIDHQAFLSARLRWVSAMGLCGVSSIGFGVKTSMQSPGVKTVIAGQGLEQAVSSYLIGNYRCRLHLSVREKDRMSQTSEPV